MLEMDTQIARCGLQSKHLLFHAHWLLAQVAAIIAAAVIAQRQADQDVDEADMSLAYSGGSGRVSLA